MLAQLSSSFVHLKTPAVDAPAAQRDPAVIRTVTEMLQTIERGGLDAVRDYARKLDGYTGGEIELSGAEIARSGAQLEPALRAAIELVAPPAPEPSPMSSGEARRLLHRARAGVDHRRALHPRLAGGRLLPAGRFPLTASAFMTVGVAKAAGVPSVIACTPPQPGGRANDAVVYAAHVSGVDRIFVLGGVQALAAMAFGLLEEFPVDMLVGAGNAYVAEAKRQLFGTAAIDLLAGPSEVAVLSDETADPEIVAADLLGQAEHGPNSPAALVTTSAEHGAAVLKAVERQLAGLATASIAGPAWRDYGSITVATDRETAVVLMDDLAPEHLEVITSDDEWYHQNLRNYGSIFLGPWSTVAYSDKGMAGTNHVLPTAGGAKHSAGLSVSRFLKPLTYQRISREATPSLAHAVQVISDSEGMAAHSATATMRLATYREPVHTA